MNYKGLTFKNDMDGFKKWCGAFPPMERGTDIKFYEKNGVYCSIEKVTMMGTSFAGITFRVYKEKDRDFEWFNREVGEKLFNDEIEDYKKMHSL